MKHLYSLLLPALLALTLGAAPSATVSCQRDIMPDGSHLEIDGLPGGASIKSGGGKTVVKAPLFSDASVYQLMPGAPALHDGSGEIVTAQALALDADPAPAMIQRRPSAVIPVRKLNTNWIHIYSRSLPGGHEITATNHCPAHSRLPAGGYA